jgi:hypothetical protein
MNDAEDIDGNGMRPTKTRPAQPRPTQPRPTTGGASSFATGGRPYVGTKQPPRQAPVDDSVETLDLTAGSMGGGRPTKQIRPTKPPPARPPKGSPQPAPIQEYSEPPEIDYYNSAGTQAASYYDQYQGYQDPEAVAAANASYYAGDMNPPRKSNMKKTSSRNVNANALRTSMSMGNRGAMGVAAAGQASRPVPTQPRLDPNMMVINGQRGGGGEQRQRPANLPGPPQGRPNNAPRGRAPPQKKPMGY